MYRRNKYTTMHVWVQRVSLILIFSFLTFHGYAQIIEFQDPALQNALVSSTWVTDSGASLPVDVNGDGLITFDEAKAVVGFLTINEFGIQNLSGFEHFNNVKQLVIDGNQFEQASFVNWNRLEGLTIRQQYFLSAFTITNAPSLDSLSLIGCPLNYDEVVISSVGSLSILNLSQTGMTTFPWNIGDFPVLTVLELGLNNLTQLGPIDHDHLLALFIDRNPLETLLLGSLPNMYYLSMRYCEISGLDVSGIPNLETLSALGNRIETLDLTSNPALEVVNLSYNPIQDIQFGEVLALELLLLRETLIQQLALNGCPVLREIRLDETPNLNLFEISNAPLLQSLTITKSKLSDLELVDLPSLTYTYLTGAGINIACLSNLPSLKRLNLNLNNLSQFELVNSPNIESLSLSGNMLNRLELDSYPFLYELYVGGNPFTHIEITNTPGLSELHIGSCGLTSIDVSHLNNLRFLYARSNKLSSISLPSSLINVYLEDNLFTDFIIPSGVSDVHLSNNPLSSISVHPDTEYLDISHTTITNLDLSASNLEGLVINHTPISDIGFPQGYPLDYLSIGSNIDADVSLLNLPFLRVLGVVGEPPAFIDFGPSSPIAQIYLADYFYDSLQFPSLPLLTEIGLNSVEFNTLDLSNLNGLSLISVNQCRVTSLDWLQTVSGYPKLNLYLSLRYNLLGPDDCPIIEEVAPHTTYIYYDIQGDLTVRPDWDTWPVNSVTKFVSGIYVPRYNLDCNL